MQTPTGPQGGPKANPGQGPMMGAAAAAAAGPRPKPLEIGDFLPEFHLADQRARPVSLVTHALGKPIVLLFYPDAARPACQQMLKAFAALHDQLSDKALLLAVSCESVEQNATAQNVQGLPFRILSDGSRHMAATYGVAHNLPGAPLDFLGSGAFTVVIADQNRRIVRLARGLTDPAAAAEVAALVESLDPGPGSLMPAVAPVLCVPRVLEPDFCRHLIQVYETQGNEASGTMHTRDSGEKVTKFDAARKVRRDHFIRDPALLEAIRVRLRSRVVPEIFRSTYYRVTHFEEFKVVCYEAADGGHFAPHRDNNNLSAAHRRFAMTLNLNTGEYEGGELTFPEFGPHLYRPAAGDAVIFSCALAHQALPVTAGRRFVLLSFLFGDEAQAMRQSRESALQQR